MADQSGQPNQQTSQPMDLLSQICRFYVSLGAPKPTLIYGDIVYYPGGAYMWDHVKFEREGLTPVDMTTRSILFDPDAGVVDLIRAGMIRGDVNNPPKFLVYTPPPPPQPPPPQPVDAVVGTLDPNHPGLYVALNQQMAFYLYMAGVVYTSPSTGRQFRPVMLGSPPFAIFDFAETIRSS